MGRSSQQRLSQNSSQRTQMEVETQTVDVIRQITSEQIDMYNGRKKRSDMDKLRIGWRQYMKSFELLWKRISSKWLLNELNSLQVILFIFFHNFQNFYEFFDIDVIETNFLGEF